MPFRILSLSGGGIRGVFQAHFLKYFRRGLGKPLRQCFDLFTGTSTGSIIAMALALGREPDEAAELYKKHGKAIFRSKPIAKIRKGPRYSSQALRKALQETFGDLTLGDCRKGEYPVHVYIPAVSVQQAKCRAFTTFTYPGMNSGADEAMTAVDAVMASSAGPTYFASVTPAVGERAYLDGGLWANTPALWAVLEVHVLLRRPFSEMIVVSIGNGEASFSMSPDRLHAFRPLSPGMIETIFDMMFAAQKDASDEFLKMLLPAGNLHRIDTDLPKLIPLDDVDAAMETLPARGEQIGKNFIYGDVWDKLRKSLLGEDPALDSRSQQ